MKPTDEQTAALDVFTAGGDLVLEAGAGTGKTSTLRLLGESTRDRGLYIAYNKAIADEAGEKFPANVDCRTAHSLAFRAVGRNYKDRLNSSRRPPWEIAKVLDIHHPMVFGDRTFQTHTLARLALEMVDNYCNSASAEITTHHGPFVEGLIGNNEGNPYNFLPDLARHLLPYAKDAWDDLQKPLGEIPFKHDHYLKMWQLSKPKLRADYILFDEAQDANPVIADIVRQQDDAQRVFVGDRAQAIYGWRGAVDAMQQFSEQAETRYLTQSFRFGPAIAEQANSWLERLDTPLRLKGTERIDSTLAPVEDPDVVLCRTNGGTVERLLAEQDAGRKAFLVGDTREIHNFCRGVVDLQTKGKSSHRDLIAFESWDQVQQYAKEEGGSLSTWVTVIDRYSPDRILAALNTSARTEQQADVSISTAHKAKGREWGTVRIADDFQPSADEDGNPKGLSEPDIMLRYVAVTRAQFVLDVGLLHTPKVSGK